MAYENLSREALAPGARFEFARFGDLHDFEDDLAPIVDPENVREYWDVRPPTIDVLSNMINADKLRVEIARPVLWVVQGDAYSRLQNARAEGWGLQAHSVPVRSDGTEKDFVGFALEALVVSTRGLAAAASLRTRIWYAPVAGFRRTSSPEARDVRGVGLTRIIAQPQVSNLDAVSLPPASPMGNATHLATSRGIARRSAKPIHRPKH